MRREHGTRKAHSCPPRRVDLSRATNESECSRTITALPPRAPRKRRFRPRALQLGQFLDASALASSQ